MKMFQPIVHLIIVFGYSKWAWSGFTMILLTTVSSINVTQYKLSFPSSDTDIMICRHLYRNLHHHLHCLLLCSPLRLRSSASSATATSSSFTVRSLRLPTMESSLVRVLHHRTLMQTLFYMHVQHGAAGRCDGAKDRMQMKCVYTGLLSTEWFRGFYGSVSECQKVQEVHALI